MKVLIKQFSVTSSVQIFSAISSQTASVYVPPLMSGQVSHPCRTIGKIIVFLYSNFSDLLKTNYASEQNFDDIFNLSKRNTRNIKRKFPLRHEIHGFFQFITELSLSR
jgi:hypothetical protein